jgi:hypothetical protein
MPVRLEAQRTITLQSDSPTGRINWVIDRQQEHKAYVVQGERW